MNYRLTIAGVAICAILMSACGTNKKLDAALMDADGLRAQVGNLEKENSQLKGQVSDLSTQNKAMSDDYSKYKTECEDVKEKYAVAQGILEKQSEALSAVEQKLETALADFKEKGVEVEYRDGYVFVSMADELLYKTGSSSLGKEGTEALGPVAAILNDYPNLKVVVLGNTDDAKFKKGANDNWSLSTERANCVVRIFRDKYKIDGARLTAAGKAMYNPIAENNTKEGRARNRRTDIILNPDLDKVWGSVKQ